MQRDGDVVLTAAGLGGFLSLVEEQPVRPVRLYRQTDLLLGVTTDVRQHRVRQLDVTELSELYRVAYSYVYKRQKLNLNVYSKFRRYNTDPVLHYS